ncbi:MAG: helix-turn-helix domain-containing protein [Solirubrobacteraceae bacterium]
MPPSNASIDPVVQLAGNLKRLRTSRDLTQEQVAHRGALTLPDIGRIERGERDPGVRVLARIAYGLGVAPADLLQDVRWTP